MKLAPEGLKRLVVVRTQL